MRIIFRKDKTGEIVAVYLDETFNANTYTLACYVHFGQHGACSIDWLYQDTKPAKEHEYIDLLRELMEYHSDYSDDMVLFNVLTRLPKYEKTLDFIKSKQNNPKVIKLDAD